MKKKLFLSAALCLPLCVNTLFAETPATLSIKGTAVAEAIGDQQALPMKLTDNVFEIYTSLQTGNYSFDGDATIAEQSITADAATPYRIRVDYSGETPVVTAQKIEQMYMWAPYSGKTLVEIPYIGKSTFKAENIICENGDNWFGSASWGECRYRIRIKFENDVLETYAPKDGQKFVSVGNEAWGGSDFNYELPGKYRNEHKPFNAIVTLSSDNDYVHELTDYVSPTPESLAVQGTALAEVESSETMPMKLGDSYFELYTSLQSGTYTFVGADIAEQTVTIEGDTPAPYRIRVDYSNTEPVVTAEKIARVYLYAPWNKFTIGELAYAGGSVFTGEKLTFDRGKWGDDRYRIRIEFEDGRYETYASNNSNELLRATDNADWGADATGHPELSYKVTGLYLQGVPFNVEVILKADGAYTHELTDYINPNAPEALSVQGTALAEADAAMPMKKESNIFEVYTTLQSGTYSFTGDENLGEQTIDVAEAAPYRIQVNYSDETPVVTAQKVEKVYMWAPRSHQELVTLPYAGNGVFKQENIVCEDGNVWFGSEDTGERRYRIRILFDDSMLETYAPKDGENFVCVGNEDWGSSDFNYTMDTKYKNDHQPFTATVTLSATEGYSHSIEDYTDAPTTGIATSESMTASIYPTVVSDYLTVQADSEDFTVELYSISGAKLLMQEHCSQEVVLGTSELANGIYLVKVSQAGTLIQLQKVVKK